MGLDNRGFNDRWIVKEDVIRHGPSGIGFVNDSEVKSIFVKERRVRQEQTFKRC